MRLLIAILLSSAALLATAQCSETNAGISAPNDLTQWMHGVLQSDDGTVSLFRPYDQLGDLEVVRTDAAGAVIWSKRFATTDLMVLLEPDRIMGMPDGGVAVCGFRYVRQNTVTVTYRNYFILRLDADGDITWARIYMRPGVDQGIEPQMAFTALSDSGFLLCTPDPLGLVATRLGPDGMPAWSKLYDMDGVAEFSHPLYHACTEATDGDLLLSMGGWGEEGLTTIRTDAAGTVQWAQRFPTGTYAQPRTITATADNGVVVAAHDIYGDVSNMPFAVRLAADGTFGWMRHYDLGSGMEDLRELPSGDLLFTQGDNDSNGVMHTDASGVPISGWNDGGLTGTDILGLDGDTVVLGSLETVNGNTWIPRIVRYDSVDDLDCNLTANAVNDFPDATPTPTSSSATAADVSMKTWTMSFGPALELNQVDMAAYLSNGPCRPGFDFGYCAHTTNQGGVTSGPSEVVLTFDPSLTFNTATPTPTSVVPGMITWSGEAALSMNGFHQYLVSMTVPQTTPLGTVFEATFSVTQDSVETTLVNNTLTRSSEVTGSFDPNDKLVWPREQFVLGTDSVLDYTIRFQNTGTDTAFTVVVVDTLPTNVDPTTFRPGASSHPYTYSITASGLLQFRFENILLPDSNTNEPLSHGLINFHIDPIRPLAPGQTITNRADIFFDFNEAVRTPDAVVTVTTPTGIRPIARPGRLQVFPVPAAEHLTALLPSGFTPASAHVLTTDGRRVQLRVRPPQGDRLDVDVSSLAQGHYVLSLVGTKGDRYTARFVKE